MLWPNIATAPVGRTCRCAWQMTRTYGCAGLVLGRWPLSAASDHVHVVVVLPTLLSAELYTHHM